MACNSLSSFFCAVFLLHADFQLSKQTSKTECIQRKWIAQLRCFKLSTVRVLGLTSYRFFRTVGRSTKLVSSEYSYMALTQEYFFSLFWINIWARPTCSPSRLFWAAFHLMAFPGWNSNLSRCNLLTGS